MATNFEENPFVKLFPSVEAARSYVAQRTSAMAKSTSVTTKSIPNQFYKINEKIERIFGISFNKYTDNAVVLLHEVSANPEQNWIDLEILEQALFERLLLEEPRTHISNTISRVNTNDVSEARAMYYLYNCYTEITNKLQSRPNDPDLPVMLELVIRNISTALKQPDFYPGQTIASDFLANYTSRYDTINDEFMNKLVDEIVKDEENCMVTISNAFNPIFKEIQNQLERCSLSSYSNIKYLEFLEAIVKNKLAAEAFIDYNAVDETGLGSGYRFTLFGSLFSISCLPRIEGGTFEFFSKGQCSDSDEGAVWSALENLHSAIHSLLFQMLKVSPVVKEKLMKWLTDCLNKNQARGKMWNTHSRMAGLPNPGLVSDAMMVNIGAVLLKLCQPIIDEKRGTKYLKIDPTYGYWNYRTDITCLTFSGELRTRPKSDTTNFVSQLFFLTHIALDLGYRVCVGKLKRHNEDMHRLVQALEDARMADGNTTEVLSALTERFDAGFQLSNSLRVALLEPKTVNLMWQLFDTTSRWLVQVILHDFPSDSNSFQMSDEIPLTFPLPTAYLSALCCIPEFFLENVICFTPFMRMFAADKLKRPDSDVLESIITMIIVTMSSNRIISNPHLRAGLAEVLESFMPKEKSNSIAYFDTKIYERHPFCREIIPSLLEVFVSMEMTGENIQFDAKFNYRRPIHDLMKYLWTTNVHRDCFQQLAKHAEQNMEATEPPLFLRFLNLLINDAVYLLDEALRSMAQLKTMQADRDSGQWNNLPVREREDNENLYTQAGMIARFDNILSKCTIQTLQYLTTEIKSIFAHPTMADRIAAMLNYFLLHLVGPNMKNFKVKESKQYAFEPGVIVSSICHIYINLADSDAFCLAVSQDGRSYNDKLFTQAEDVLCRIQEACLVPDLVNVASKVARLGAHQKKRDELFADAPDDFLDPIMSTIMTDPVILPTSHVTVDRTTIVRYAGCYVKNSLLENPHVKHLLSDQTDPFNRSPLTMDLVKPDDALRQRIQAWMESMETSSAPK